LKSENIMMLNTIDILENKLKESKDLLKKLCSDNLKSPLYIHTDNYNKLGIIVDNLGASTTHASDFELNSLFTKHVIVDLACLDNSENSCLNDYVKPKSKELGIQGKFFSYLSSLWDYWSH
jgi:hypothetical protein